ncbi:MAG: LytTR family DNA-binding domain-containing protein [Ignavibacteriaceae bacterium]
MSDKIKTIIIDDEKLARQITKGYLSKHPEIELIAECSGFEMLELLEDPPAIIFTTAYDQYAIKAFEVSAVDYLLKPFSEERFNEALKKSYSLIEDKFQQNSAIKNIIDHHDEKIEFLERIVIKDGSKISIVPVDSIKWIEAQDDYVMINSEQGRFLKKKTMKFFENHLDENLFIRIHRSYIINADFIQHLEQKGKESYQLILKNGRELPVSKTGLSKLKSTL